MKSINKNWKEREMLGKVMGFCCSCCFCFRGGGWGAVGVIPWPALLNTTQQFLSHLSLTPTKQHRCLPSSVGEQIQTQ